MALTANTVNQIHNVGAAAQIQQSARVREMFEQLRRRPTPPDPTEPTPQGARNGLSANRAQQAAGRADATSQTAVQNLSARTAETDRGSAVVIRLSGGVGRGTSVGDSAATTQTGSPTLQAAQAQAGQTGRSVQTQTGQGVQPVPRGSLYDLYA